MGSKQEVEVNSGKYVGSLKKLWEIKGSYKEVRVDSRKLVGSRKKMLEISEKC